MASAFRRGTKFTSKRVYNYEIPHYAYINKVMKENPESVYRDYHGRKYIQATRADFGDLFEMLNGDTTTGKPWLVLLPLTKTRQLRDFDFDYELNTELHNAHRNEIITITSYEQDYRPKRAAGIIYVDRVVVHRPRTI
jgi:hypothetical protein